MGNQQDTNMGQMTQLSESVKRTRKRRLERMMFLRVKAEEGREQVYQKLIDSDKKRQFRKDCQDIWLQCNGNRKLYRQLVSARKKFLEITNES